MSRPVADVFGKLRVKAGVNYSPETLAVACPADVARAVAERINLLLDHPEDDEGYDSVVVLEACGGLGGNSLGFVNHVHRLARLVVHETRADRRKFLTTNLAKFGRSDAWVIEPTPLDDFSPPTDLPKAEIVVFADLAAVDTDLGLPLAQLKVGGALVIDWVKSTRPLFYLFRTAGPHGRTDAIPLRDGTFLVVLAGPSARKSLRAKRSVVFSEINDVRLISPRRNRDAPEPEEPEEEFYESEGPPAGWVEDLRGFVYEFLQHFVPETLAEQLVSERNTPFWVRAFTAKTVDYEQNYEEDELIGDRLLEPAFVVHMVKRFPNISSSMVTPIKNRYFSEVWQSNQAKAWGFGPHIRATPAGFSADTGQPLTSFELTIHNYEDVFESFAAALYYSALTLSPPLGMELVQAFVDFVLRDQDISLDKDYTDDSSFVNNVVKELGGKVVEVWENNQGSLSVDPSTLWGVHGLRAPPRGVLGQAMGNSRKAAMSKAYASARQFLTRSGAVEVYEKLKAGRDRPGKKQAAVAPEFSEDELDELRNFLYEDLFPTFIPSDAVRESLVDDVTKMAVWSQVFRLAAPQLDSLGEKLFEAAFTILMVQRAGGHVGEDRLNDAKREALNRVYQFRWAVETGLTRWARVPGVSAEEINASEDMFERFGRPDMEDPKQSLAAARKVFKAQVLRHGQEAMPMKGEHETPRERAQRVLFRTFIGGLYTVAQMSSPGLGFLLVQRWTNHLFQDTHFDFTKEQTPAKTFVQQSMDGIGARWENDEKKYDAATDPTRFEQTTALPDGRFETVIRFKPRAIAKLKEAGFDAKEIFAVGRALNPEASSTRAYIKIREQLEDLGFSPAWIRENKAMGAIKGLSAAVKARVQARMEGEGYSSYEFEKYKVGRTLKGNALLIGVRGKHRTILAHAHGRANDAEAFRAAFQAYDTGR